MCAVFIKNSWMNEFLCYENGGKRAKHNKSITCEHRKHSGPVSSPLTKIALILKKRKETTKCSVQLINKCVGSFHIMTVPIWEISNVRYEGIKQPRCGFPLQEMFPLWKMFVHICNFCCHWKFATDTVSDNRSSRLTNMRKHHSFDCCNDSPA